MAISPVKSERRVLGDLSLNTPSKTAKLPPNSTKCRQGFGSEQAASSPVKQALFGQKRRFDQFNGLARSSPPPSTLATTAAVPDARSLGLSSAEAPSNPSTHVGDDTAPAQTQDQATTSMTDASSMTAPPTPTETIRAPADEPAKGDEALMEADGRPWRLVETLALRLRLALYKVQTEQVQTPFAELREMPVKRHRSEDSEDAVASSAPAQKKARPAPVLALTSSTKTSLDAVLPSSPPDSADRMDEDTERPHHGLATPVRPRHHIVQVQLSSPPDSQGGDETVPEINLTSSVVRGRAATGLLELKGMA